jgi:hypothetical protein
MRVPAFPMVASMVLLAAPAFAQTGAMTGAAGQQNLGAGYGYGSTGMSTVGGNDMTGAYNTGADNGGAYNSAANNNAAAGTYNGNNGMNGAYGNTAMNGSNSETPGAFDVTPNTRERIRQSLLQSGFRDVSVLPQSFVIRAMAPDGSRVVMLLRPDMVAGIVASSANRGTANNAWNGGSANYGNGTGNYGATGNMNYGDGNANNGGAGNYGGGMTR